MKNHLGESLIVPNSWKDGRTKRQEQQLFSHWWEILVTTVLCILKCIQIFMTVKIWNEQLLAIPLTFFKSFFKKSFWII